MTGSSERATRRRTSPPSGDAGAPNWANQTIWTGDNIDIMRGMNSASVDLIYLDPPFNSKANYAAPIGSRAAGAAFKDTWTLRDVDVEWINLIEAKHPALYRVILAAMTDSDKSYLAYMAARLLEMRRILKPSGSIYLHCDPTMGAYLRLIMDAIFGQRAFRNEIIWCYFGGGRSTRNFARKHDILLRYAMGNFVFNGNPIRIPYRAEGLGRTDDSMWGKHKGSEKIYKPHPLGKIPEDWWMIHQLNANSPERTGYPTQKPLELLDRIIRASSDEGGIVLDPFCGCATACIAAEKLNRQWAGIDISPKAADLVVERMHKELNLFFRGAHRTDIPGRTDIGNVLRYNDIKNKRYLYGEQDGRCTGCGEHFMSQHLEVDHIVPRAKGGTDHLSNLQLLCSYCNRVKGDRGMEYLRVKLQLAASIRTR